MSKVRVAVVGFGYWGPNLVRNFISCADAEVLWICDSRQDRVDRVHRLYPGVGTTSSIDDVLNDPAIDLVAFATPVSTHFPLAMRALEARKHVLLEKPMAASYADAGALLRRAAAVERRIFVDHTFLFVPAVVKMKALASSGDLGRLHYYDSSRISLGLFQHDVDVIWDLLPHDLSILDYLLDGALPQSVCAQGASHYNDLADQAYVTLVYPDNFIAHIHVNWVAPVKVRQILFCGDRRMCIYDENTPHEKLRVYDRGVTVRSAEDVYKRMVEYREGDMFAPRLEPKEALTAEIENIVGTLLGREEPIVSGEVGARIVLLLEAATASLRHNGRPVMVDPGDRRIRLTRRKTDERSA